MGLRVKNVAAGFVDATGFHPIRRSQDYDPERAGDDYGSAKDDAGLKYRMVTRGGKRVRVPAGALGPAKRKKKAASRKRNPIPTKWVKAQVKRLGDDVQVMLFPKGAVARRRATRRKTARRRRS